MRERFVSSSTSPHANGGAPLSGCSPAVQTLRKPCRIGSAPAYNKDRAVAGKGADVFRQRRAIDRHAQRLRLSGIVFQDPQLIDDVVAAKVVVNRRSTF